MGRIPEYQRSQMQSMVDPSRITQPLQDASMVARTVEMAGAFAQKVHDVRKDSFITKRALELENQTASLFESWQKENEADPIGKRDALKEKLSGLRDSLLEDAPNSAAQTEFGVVADRYFMQLERKAEAWEKEQLTTNTARTSQEALESLQIKLQRNPNGQNFDLLMQEGETALSPLEMAAGRDVALKAKDQYSSALATTMFESLIEKNNISEARTLLKSQNYDSYLKADGIARVERMIDTRLRQNESVSKKVEQLKFKSPWDYYLYQGGKANPISFDPSQDRSGQALRDSLLQREDVLADAQGRFNLELPMLTPQETDGFINTLNRMGPKDAVDFFNFYDVNVEDGTKARLARDVFKQEPSMGIALSIAGEAPADASMIIVGQRLMRSEKDGPKVTAAFVPKQGYKDLDLTFDTYIGRATENPGLRQQIKEAARAHYVASALGTNKTALDFDERLFEKSIAAVSAPVATINDHQVFSFRNKGGAFVEPDDLEDFVGDLDDSLVEAVHKDVPRVRGGEPLNMEKASGRVKFISAGDGQYYMDFQGQALVDKNGSEFKIDLKKIYHVKESMPKQSWLDKFKGISILPKANAETVPNKPGTPMGKL